MSQQNQKFKNTVKRVVEEKKDEQSRANVQVISTLSLLERVNRTIDNMELFNDLHKTTTPLLNKLTHLQHVLLEQDKARDQKVETHSAYVGTLKEIDENLTIVNRHLDRYKKTNAIKRAMIKGNVREKLERAKA